MPVPVIVVPEEFHYVVFDAARIAAVVGELAGRAGVPDSVGLRVEVDERSPFGRTRTVSLDPITIAVESGAFEDGRRPRKMSEVSVISVVGRLLFRALDRGSPAFTADASPPPDGELSLAHYAAWDAYAVGRCDRLGYPQQKARRRYHFRVRHGFSDAADETFDRLWNGAGLTWADVVAASDGALAAAGEARPGARSRSRTSPAGRKGGGERRNNTTPGRQPGRNLPEGANPSSS